MTDFVALIERWPSLTEFSNDMGVPYGTAKQWRARKSIPPRHWPQLCKAAKGRKFPDVKVENLLGMMKSARG